MIFARLVSIFLAVLFPLLAIGYSVYNWGLQAVKNEITSSYQAQVDFYRENLEQELQRIRLLQFNMLNDSTVNILEVANTQLTNYEQDMDLIHVQERVESIKYSSRYISHVTVLMPALNKSVSDLNIHEMRPSDNTLIHSVMTNPKDQIHEIDGSLWLLVSSFQDVAKDSSSRFTIIGVELSKDYLQQMLQELQIQQGSNAYLFSWNPPFSIVADQAHTQADQIAAILQSHPLKNSPEGYESFSVDKEPYVMTYASSSQQGLTLVKSVKTSQMYKKINHYRNMFVIYSITALFVISIFTLLLYRLIHKPLKKLVKAFRQVENGNMEVEIKHHSKDEFRHIFTRFNAMISNLRDLIDQVYKQNLLIKQAELKQLQTQINPHFLYNSFFVLHRWIRYGFIEEAELFSRHLGNYFQFVTRSSAEEIQLEREVEHARTYTEIQSMRFSRRIQVRFEELPSGLGNILVPRLILQPIIENAFEHGLEDKRQNGLLVVHFLSESNRLHMIFEDNGDQLADTKLVVMKRELIDSETITEITGLTNIHKRLQIRFGEHSGISHERSELGGLKVTLTIPIET
ncbi:hypothetical protein A8709_13330 [Paenibacillus pectinilyticus]|uniref:HAMP domain-containing protein n=1 Tax=Paenibacillus pectinilyticus TaxID=512399 RepID=A0A1C1A3F3_9BACL|nr:histidine kinase [Paenibacillus pectinilyticus]OCT15089.1 hypothetical protein A8709_13330 [Paenibacillus pectinilyticus]